MFNFMLLKIKEKYLKILVIKTVLLLNLVFKNFDNNNFDQQTTSFQLILRIRIIKPSCQFVSRHTKVQI